MSFKVNDIFDPDQEQVLIDLETLSTRKDAAIIAIGATKFTLNAGITDKFYINVSAMDCRNYGLHFSTDTIDWWKKQPKETSDLWKVDPQPLRTSLAAFEVFYGGKSKPTWGNSPRFDMAILESAFDAVGGIALPWSYRDECDFRTLAKIIPVEWEHEGIPHYALDDAIGETLTLIKVLKG